MLPLATAERSDDASGLHIRTGPQIMDFAMLHEVLHTMGFVPTCAAHHTRSGHVFDNPRDIMFVGDEPWRPAILDVGQDDYYHAGRGEDDPGERASRPRTR